MMIQVKCAYNPEDPDWFYLFDIESIQIKKNYKYNPSGDICDFITLKYNKNNIKKEYNTTRIDCKLKNDKYFVIISNTDIYLCNNDGDTVDHLNK